MIYKEIIVVVPEDTFGKLPEKIEYKAIPFGRMEKAKRLLIRSILSAIDNGKNALKYGELRKKYREKSREASQLNSKIYNLREDVDKLKSTMKEHNLKIEGCSVIGEKIKESEKLLKEVRKEMEIIKQQVPKYMWDNMYWW